MTLSVIRISTNTRIYVTAYWMRARRKMAEAASLMIAHNMDHVDQAIRASSEAERCRVNLADRMGDRP